MYTKGEWWITGDGEIISMPSQIKIAFRVSGSNEKEAEANRKLLLAAPDLLEACKHIKHALEHEGWEGGGRIPGALENVTTAIKKAIGEWYETNNTLWRI